MGTRIRNGYLYFRKTVRDEDGRKHYLERKINDFSTIRKISNEPITNEQVEAIFKRFPEPNTAHIPLHMMYFCGMDKDAVYELTEASTGLLYLSDDTKKLLQRQINRISVCSLLYGYSTDYLVINLQTGERISPYQMDYITKVIRREINPTWNWKRWMGLSQKLQSVK